jgi:hypothetical protein
MAAGKQIHLNCTATGTAERGQFVEDESHDAKVTLAD